MDARDADVVVVGGGLAGLVAARDLVRAGKRVVVLEARERVGGRTLTEEVGGARVDLGAQWIGAAHHRLSRLVAELGVETFPQYARGKKVLDRGDGKLRTFSGFMPAIGLVGLVDLGLSLRALERLAAQVPLDRPMAAPEAAALDAMSVEDWLAANVRTARARAMLALATQMIFAAEPRDVSALYFLLYARSGGGVRTLAEIEGGAQQTRFATGAQEVCARLAAPLGERVRLGHAMQAIEQAASGLRVTTARGVVTCARAIVAVPPALARGLGDDLPIERIALHERMRPGSVIKCVAAYETPFWRAAGYSGEAMSTTGLVRATFDDCDATGEHAALVAFVVGDAARSLSKAAPEDRRRLVLSELGRLHGPAAHRAIAYADKDWLADEWSAGCYVGVMPPRLLTETAAGLRAPHGRVHFAGTETAREHIGYLEGAIESGERAAREVIDALA